jgi:transcriptional regulator with XRE-family HTH domain
MEQLVSAPPDGPVGAVLRAFRHRACLSQEQLAARAELSERTVRNLEAGRVRSPRAATARLLADALELGEPERESWFAAARGANGRQAEPAIAGAGGPAQLPPRLTVAVLTGDAQDASGLAITCLIDKAGETVLAVQCAPLGAAGYPARPPGCLVLVSCPHQFNGPAARDGLRCIAFARLAPAR